MASDSREIRRKKTTWNPNELPISFVFEPQYQENASKWRTRSVEYDNFYTISFLLKMKYGMIYIGLNLALHQVICNVKQWD